MLCLKLTDKRLLIFEFVVTQLLRRRLVNERRLLVFIVYLRKKASSELLLQDFRVQVEVDLGIPL